MTKRVLPWWLKPKIDRCSHCGVILRLGFETEPSYHDPTCEIWHEEHDV
jgi:hypothetical protein